MPRRSKGVRADILTTMFFRFGILAFSLLISMGCSAGPHNDATQPDGDEDAGGDDAAQTGDGGQPSNDGGPANETGAPVLPPSHLTTLPPPHQQSGHTIQHP